MINAFHLFDMILLVALAILIYKNKDWKYQPIFIIVYIIIFIAAILSIILF